MSSVLRAICIAPSASFRSAAACERQQGGASDPTAVPVANSYPQRTACTACMLPVPVRMYSMHDNEVVGTSTSTRPLTADAQRRRCAAGILQRRQPPDAPAEGHSRPHAPVRALGRAALRAARRRGGHGVHPLQAHLPRRPQPLQRPPQGAPLEPPYAACCVRCYRSPQHACLSWRASARGAHRFACVPRDACCVLCSTIRSRNAAYGGPCMRARWSSRSSTLASRCGCSMTRRTRATSSRARPSTPRPRSRRRGGCARRATCTPLVSSCGRWLWGDRCTSSGAPLRHMHALSLPCSSCNTIYPLRPDASRRVHSSAAEPRRS